MPGPSGVRVPPSTLSYRKRKAQEAEAAVMTETTKKRTRAAYTCNKCGQVSNKTTGHSQYYGYVYCPNEEGQVPYSQWKEARVREREAQKKEKESGQG